ncbi:hypothetical protein F5Y16DRAFT_163451 [Xylariaceae sp. FL0255]|nr:hypothetical protein F5Y16DRAFT_163451 [Xylariaceae sp. FL0255]
MPDKRKRAVVDDARRAANLKRTRHTDAPDLLSPLSDEILVRILSFLPLLDVLNLAPVSDRFYHLSGDSQVWKGLYYSRFVLPRALRIPGFRNGTAHAGKLHYSSRRTIWADGRRGGWVDMHTGSQKDTRNWKKQYKLRHNWARGKCAVEELHVGDEHALSELRDSAGQMLVKVLDGIAVTADSFTGLRIWDLKSKQLLAHSNLNNSDPNVRPGCLALDNQFIDRDILDAAIGFTDGSFGIWQLSIKDKRIIRRYRHESSSNGELVGAAFLYPYLLIATKSVLVSLYTFEHTPEHSSKDGGGSELDSETEKVSDSETLSEFSDWEKLPHERHKLRPAVVEALEKRSRAGPSLPAPYLLTSLRSHTSRAPLALSLRKTSINMVASIAYTFSTIRGWSLGIQELHIRPNPRRPSARPDISTTQLAYTLPVNRTSSSHMPSPPATPARHPLHNGSNTIHDSDENSQDHGPISLSYTHPYLLATLPDNTLILYLCTSNASALSISPGIRLWGHTSGISDAEITARGKAVSVSSRGDEIRVWELEGRTNGHSVEVRPTAGRGLRLDKRFEEKEKPVLDRRWDERRNWVGFDDEMVIVLKESGEGRESLLVYDFT